MLPVGEVDAGDIARPGRPPQDDILLLAIITVADLEPSGSKEFVAIEVVPIMF
jgi:hypothetical protein